MSLVAV